MFYGGGQFTMQHGCDSKYILRTTHNIFKLKGHGGGFKLTLWSFGFYSIHDFFTIFSFETLIVYEPKVYSFPNRFVN
jgi:hypothetical protein